MLLHELAAIADSLLIQVPRRPINDMQLYIIHSTDSANGLSEFGVKPQSILVGSWNFNTLNL